MDVQREAAVMNRLKSLLKKAQSERDVAIKELMDAKKRERQVIMTIHED